ncbi:MAG: ATP-binding protein [Muribaculaceae bacterium]|nr:ATP-binding protein [Muribaculaceae bacterium]
MKYNDIIERPIYLDKAIRLLDKGMMLIITGQRRVGKSCLLLQIKQRLETTSANANVIYIDKEELGNHDINNYISLYNKVKSSIDKDKHNYLLIDEVQDIDGFEHVLRSIHAENLCQIIATGSNAKVLSSELSTILGGRYFELNVNSLSYKEFLLFHNLDDSDKSLRAYLTYGGLPGLRKIGLSQEEEVGDYLENVYNAIVLKDVIAREQIRNVRFLEKLIAFVADNIGKKISTRNISRYVENEKSDASPTTVSSYLKFLTNAYIIKDIDGYDIHGKKLLEQTATYYFQDMGLCNYLAGFKLGNHIEKIIENAIWHHLITCGYKVKLGALRAGDIDFVATKRDKTLYIQATYVLENENTVKREFGNLMLIKDNFPKFVVSMDPLAEDRSDYPGIKYMHLREFLLTDF